MNNIRKKNCSHARHKGVWGVGVYLHSFFTLTIGGSELSVSSRCRFSAGRDTGEPLKTKMWARERRRVERSKCVNYVRNPDVINIKSRK